MQLIEPPPRRTGTAEAWLRDAPTSMTAANAERHCEEQSPEGPMSATSATLSAARAEMGSVLVPALSAKNAA